MTAETPQTFAYGAMRRQYVRIGAARECGFDAYCSPSQVVASYLLASTKAGTTHPNRERQAMSDESPRDALISDTTDALWAAFEADDNCYADSEMDVIDTSGADFSLYPIAASLIAALEFQGYTITRPVLREDQQ